MADLEEMCKSGDPNTAYEALQMYRSRSNRHIHKGDKGDRSEYEAAVQVSATGAVNLAANGYDSAALELAVHITDLLVAKSMTMDTAIQNCVTNIDDAFEVNSKSRGTFLKNCIRWDRACGARVLGDPLLHARLAFNLWENDATRVQATHHFALGEAPDRLAAKLELVKEDLVRERLLVMGVLHFLGVENLRDATELVSQYKRHRVAACKAGSKPQYSALVRFCDQLVRLCLRDAAPLFQKLCTTNARDLAFDESIPALIKGPIASIYFNIKPEQRMNPMLQALLGGLH